jgi:hypothetical protein
VIAYYLWRRGLLRSLDREKWDYFWGRSPDPMHLSRAYPLWRSLRLWGLLFRPRYAAAVAAWLEYRVALYDGRQG